MRAPERGTHRLARSPLKFEFSGAVTGSARGALTPCVSRTVHPLITCSSLACSVLITRVSTHVQGPVQSQHRASAQYKHGLSACSALKPHSLRSHDPAYINHGACSQRHFLPKLLQDEHHTFKCASFTKSHVDNHAQEGKKGEGGSSSKDIL